MRFDGKKYHELFHAEETEAAQKTVAGEIVKPKKEDAKEPEETKPAEEPQEENETDPAEEPQEEPQEVEEDGNN